MISRVGWQNLVISFYDSLADLLVMSTCHAERWAFTLEGLLVCITPLGMLVGSVYCMCSKGCQLEQAAIAQSAVHDNKYMQGSLWA